MAPAKSWIARRRNGIASRFLFPLLVLGTAGLTACGSSSTGPSQNGQEPDATVLFPGLTVSDAGGAGGALMSSTEGVTYISACPGTFEDARMITITNVANGKKQYVTPFEGGFDPLPLEAQPGDEIEILVRLTEGSTSRFLTRVPPRRRPRVVRTVPPKDATDVVLSVSVLVVFSEPLDSSTLTPGTIQLRLDGDPVEATLALRDDGLKADLTPSVLLQAGATYSLVITTGVRDLEGDGLEEAVQLEFTTGTAVASVGAGWWHTCALTIAGDVYCWGANWWGQLGRPAHNDEQRAMPVPTTVKFATIALGSGHTCGLTASGDAYCWGWNDAGQLGDGSTANRHQPAPVIGGHSFVALAAGYKHTCGISQDGAAYCWGMNDLGELGIPQDGASFCDGWPCSPEPVPVSGELSFVSIAAGDFHTCGLTAADNAYCWGYNGHYRLGSTQSETCYDPDNNEWVCSTIPVAVSGGLSFVSLTAGGGHTCGLTPSGTGYCWGLNNVGQMGNGEIGAGPGGDYHALPVAVVGGQSYASLSAGESYTCGLKTNGQAFCWGNNASGQLGIGEQAGSFVFPEPVAVVGGHVFEAVTTGFDHTCALSSERAVYCWGYNGDGELGTPSSQGSAFSPRRVPYLP